MLAHPNHTIIGLAFLLLFLPSAKAENPVQATTHKEVLLLMGSRFEISASHENDSIALQSIEAAIEEIRRIEHVISSWDPESYTSEINRQAGIAPVEVPDELFQLIERSLRISKLTRGAFDISYASMDRIWKFDGSMTTMPDSQAVAHSVDRVGFQNVILDYEKKTVFLARERMKIGFGAIGKGYAANRAKAVMMDMEITSGTVNAGGDLISWNTSDEITNKRIGIVDPNNKERMLAWLQSGNSAIVTSGDYERFITFKGRRYAHIIDPRTGYPVQGIKSVTVICKDAELADALATSVFVLGVKEGLHLVNQLAGIECLIIDGQNELHQSTNLQLNYEK